MKTLEGDTLLRLHPAAHKHECREAHNTGRIFAV